MKLYAFHGGGLIGTMATYDPFDADPGAPVDIPYFFYLVQHPEGSLLFDTGCHPDLITDPRRRLGAAADAWDIRMQPGDDVVGQLSTVGMTPDDIQYVALSHLHYDHAGGVEFFPRATFLVQRAELRFAHWPPVYQRHLYVRQDFDHPIRWKELSGEYDVFGDERVLLFPTPGHTAGHQSLLVRLNSQTIVLTADAAYTKRNIEQRILPGIVWSPDAMVESWEKIEELQRLHDASIVFTHDREWSERTRVAPLSWYE